MFARADDLRRFPLGVEGSGLQDYAFVTAA